MANEFDVLFNNITSNQAPGLDEYEKSVFLTKAQDEIVLAYFTPKSNKLAEGFDDSRIRQADFNGLIVSQDFNMSQATFTDAPIAIPVCPVPSVSQPVPGIYFVRTTGSGKDFSPLIILNESVWAAKLVSGDLKTFNKAVVPISYDEFDRLMLKPYKRPVKNAVWKIVNKSDSNIVFIGAPDDEMTNYFVRYVKRPSPIITANFDNGVTIDGRGEESACELDPIVHRDIVQRAVELAKAAYVGDLASTVQLGNASQTGIGVIATGR